MSLTQSLVFPISSLVSVDSVPITLSARRRTKNNSQPERFAPFTTRSGASSDGANMPKIPIRPSAPLSGVSKPSATNSIQSFGAAIGLGQDVDGKLVVYMASENSQTIMGYSPDDLFGLQDFADLLDDQETDALLEHVDSAHDRASYSNTLNVFDLSIRDQSGLIRNLSCVIHTEISRPSLILCEFIPQPSTSFARQSQRMRSRKTRTDSRPPISRRGSATDTLNTMSKAHRTISGASTIEGLLENLVASIKVATSHSNISVHRFDSHFGGRLVAQSGSNEDFACFPHSSGPHSCNLSPESRTIFETLEIQEHSNQDHETARLLLRPGTTHEHRFESDSLYLRTLPDFPVQELDEGSAKSRVLIPLRVSGKLWGVVVSKSAQSDAAITFLSRGLCRVIADAASTKLENLGASQILDARGPFSHDLRPGKESAVAFSSPQDLVNTLRADFAISFIDGIKRLIGTPQEPQEGLALVEYLRLDKPTEIFTSDDFATDIPLLHYQPGFQSVRSLMFVPLSQDSEDFVVYFREVHPSGLPDRGIDAWSETDLQNAAMMRIVYFKFSAIWKERNSALEESHMYKLLVSNSSHEFRTLLNAISNYLEIAEEGQLDVKASEVVRSAKSTSQSLLSAITKLLNCIGQGLAT
jgi:light-regulated signal transduction histidine kinase (bacteriophytochrome)